MTSRRGGRRSSRVRTPALIRDYLAGRDGPDGPWPDDTDAQRAVRAAQGDYTTRIHQRVKAYIRLHAPRGLAHQWPRWHSFYSGINLLIRLGLIEKTGATAEPEDRGAGHGGTSAGFNPRTWVRLTAGSVSDSRWDDPMGQTVTRTHQAATPVPAPEPAAPELDEVVPRRGRRAVTGQNGPQPPPKPRTRVTESASGLGDAVEARRQALLARAAELGGVDLDTGELLDAQPGAMEEYQQLHDDAVQLATEVWPVHDRTVVNRLTEGINLMQGSCVALGQGALTPRQRAGRLRSCQSSARVLAEGLRAKFD